MKVALYIDNRDICSVNCSSLSYGNPGIGGTEYCILFLAQMLKEFYPNIEVILFVERNQLLPDVNKVITVNGLDDLIKKAKVVDILVLSSRREGNPLEQSFFDELEKNSVKTILWGHNYYYADYCERIADCSMIRANVFVGRQQYDRYIDHRLIKKSTFIYNMYSEAENRRITLEGNHTVTYIGSLIPEKGFQVLASAWKTIISRIPDAQLMVIGGGRLYSRNSVLGPYGIAEESFEKEFMKCLTDDKGRILPSVKFLGVMGTEKEEIIVHTCVGVVNPTGRTETFGISALDFESRGVPVVTVAKGGFLDTIIDHKTGILVNNPKRIANAIICLLTDSDRNKKYGDAGVELSSRFSPKIIVDDWVSLFSKVINDEKIAYIKPYNFYTKNCKFVRIANRRIKTLFHINRGFSVIWLETIVKNCLRRIGR